MSLCLWYYSVLTCSSWQVVRAARSLVISALVAFAALQLVLPCAAASDSRLKEESVSRSVKTTYERFLPLAEAGDPSIQNFIGFMYFYGDGVELDYDKAHYWYHLAAEEGEVKAQRNLGVFHSGSLPRIPEKYYAPKEANLWFSLAAANSRDPEISKLASRSYGKFLATDIEKLLKDTEKRLFGETVFVTFCAGCHGFDGHAAYPGASSFALGQRLQQSNSVLVESILNGKGLMPAWGNLLSEELGFAAVAYLRRLDKGVAGEDQVAESLTPAQQHTGNKRSNLESGEQLYLQFCGGCHGFNGIAWYVNSPSFALRERLHKSNKDLANSIRYGIGVMPSWENMLHPTQIDALVKFIRTLSKTYESGIGTELNPTPELFFRFRPIGETGSEWIGANP